MACARKLTSKYWGVGVSTAKKITSGHTADPLYLRVTFGSDFPGTVPRALHPLYATHLARRPVTGNCAWGTETAVA